MPTYYLISPGRAQDGKINITAFLTEEQAAEFIPNLRAGSLTVYRIVTPEQQRIPKPEESVDLSTYVRNYGATISQGQLTLSTSKIKNVQFMSIEGLSAQNIQRQAQVPGAQSFGNIFQQRMQGLSPANLPKKPVNPQGQDRKSGSTEAVRKRLREQFDRYLKIKRDEIQLGRAQYNAEVRAHNQRHPDRIVQELDAETYWKKISPATRAQINIVEVMLRALDNPDLTVAQMHAEILKAQNRLAVIFPDANRGIQQLLNQILQSPMFSGVSQLPQITSATSQQTVRGLAVAGGEQVPRYLLSAHSGLPLTAPLTATSNDPLPVITPSGDTINFNEIDDYIQKKVTHPVTRQPLKREDFIPNRDLAAVIKQYKNGNVDDTHLCCHISLTLIEDRVMATPHGLSFSNEMIEGWILRSGTDPYTNQKITLNDLRPNKALQEAIADYKARLQAQREQEAAPAVVASHAMPTVPAASAAAASSSSSSSVSQPVLSSGVHAAPKQAIPGTSSSSQQQIVDSDIGEASSNSVRIALTEIFQQFIQIHEPFSQELQRQLYVTPLRRDIEWQKMQVDVVVHMANQLLKLLAENPNINLQSMHRALLNVQQELGGLPKNVFTDNLKNLITTALNFPIFQNLRAAPQVPQSSAEPKQSTPSAAAAAAASSSPPSGQRTPANAPAPSGSGFAPYFRIPGVTPQQPQSPGNASKDSGSSHSPKR